MTVRILVPLGDTLRTTDDVMDQAMGLGLDASTLADKVRLAAPYTGEGFNRRNGNILFRVIDQVLEEVTVDEPAPVQSIARDRSGMKTYDCPVCDVPGELCMECNSTGKLRLYPQQYEELMEELHPYG